MEGLLINISNYKQFTLYSKLRKREFRFIRYTGENYIELVKYLTEVSPATKVWDENCLEIGRLYTYSGRDASFHYVPEEMVRCVIASNPYMVSEGKNIPLYFSTDKAAKYLQEERGNRVFCYEEILNTYAYNPDNKCFLLINYEHPNGIECSELPKNNEWYIGWQDGIEKARCHYKINKTDANHVISIHEDLEDFVETIDRLRYDINNLRDFQKNPVMFNVSWQDYQRRKDMAEQCLSEQQLMNFAICLYAIIFEETKVGQRNKKALYKYAQHPFITYIGELRNHYAHARDQYESSNSIIGVDVFKRYLGHSHGALCASDYLRIQTGLFEDFIKFLNEIYTDLMGQVIISGIVSRGENDRVCCAGILLPPHFSVFVGRMCLIKKIVLNTDIKSQARYKYYTQYIEHIELNDIDLVRQGEKKSVICDRYRIPVDVRVKIGSYIRITKIKPDPRFDPQEGIIGEMVGFEQVKTMPLVEKGANPPSFKVGEQCKVEVNWEKAHVGNILLVGKKECLKGDIVKLSVIENNADEETKIYYPYISSKFDFVKKVTRPDNPEKESIWHKITHLFG